MVLPQHHPSPSPLPPTGAESPQLPRHAGRAPAVAQSSPCRCDSSVRLTLGSAEASGCVRFKEQLPQRVSRFVVETDPNSSSRADAASVCHVGYQRRRSVTLASRVALSSDELDCQGAPGSGAGGVIVQPAPRAYYNMARDTRGQAVVQREQGTNGPGGCSARLRRTVSGSER